MTMLPPDFPDFPDLPDLPGPSPSPSPPETPQRFSDLFAERDSSLALAAAALARVADGQGHAMFGELAVAYREEFLQLRARAQGASLPELGSLSVEEFRASLRTSVLPRLALLKVVTYPLGPLGEDAPVTFAPQAWEELRADPAAADRLLEAAERALARAEPSAAPPPPVAGASLLEARDLVKVYKGRRVVNDVSARLEQGEIVGLLGPNGAGKTTTFYIITGLIRPDGGRIKPVMM